MSKDSVLHSPKCKGTSTLTDDPKDECGPIAHYFSTKHSPPAVDHQICPCRKDSDVDGDQHNHQILVKTCENNLLEALRNGKRTDSE